MRWVDKDSGPQIYDIVMPDGEWRYEDETRFLHQPQGYERRGYIKLVADGSFEWRAVPPQMVINGVVSKGSEADLATAKKRVEDAVSAMCVG
jgi:hypothetical protein